MCKLFFIKEKYGDSLPGSRRNYFCLTLKQVSRQCIYRLLHTFGHSSQQKTCLCNLRTSKSRVQLKRCSRLCDSVFEIVKLSHICIKFCIVSNICLVPTIYKRLLLFKFGTLLKSFEVRIFFLSVKRQQNHKPLPADKIVLQYVFE